MQKSIPSNLVEQLKQKSIANVVAKVKGGGVPTKAEWELIEEAKAAGEDVPDAIPGLPKHTKKDATMRAAIMSQFGISERKAFDWIKKLEHLKTPKGWPVAQALAEIQERKVARGQPANSDLKRDLLQEQVLMMRARRMEAEGRLIDVAEAKAEYSKAIAIQRQALENTCRTLASKNPEIAEKIEYVEQRILEAMRGAI